MMGSWHWWQTLGLMPFMITVVALALNAIIRIVLKPTRR